MYCKNCGKKLKEKEEYCSNCGQGKNEPVTKTVSASNTKVKNKNASLKLNYILFRHDLIEVIKSQSRYGIIPCFYHHTVKIFQICFIFRFIK